jgi:hypothetical protein
MFLGLFSVSLIGSWVGHNNPLTNKQKKKREREEEEDLYVMKCYGVL